MQECFESRDISQLQAVLSKMPRDEAAHHLDRCIKSGLWIPNAKDAEGNEDGDDESKYDVATTDEVSDQVEKLQVQPEKNDI